MRSFLCLTLQPYEYRWKIHLCINIAWLCHVIMQELFSVNNCTQNMFYLLYLCQFVPSRIFVKKQQKQDMTLKKNESSSLLLNNVAYVSLSFIFFNIEVKYYDMTIIPFIFNRNIQFWSISFRHLFSSDTICWKLSRHKISYKLLFNISKLFKDNSRICCPVDCFHWFKEEGNTTVLWYCFWWNIHEWNTPNFYEL